MNPYFWLINKVHAKDESFQNLKAMSVDHDFSDNTSSEEESDEDTDEEEKIRQSNNKKTIIMELDAKENLTTSFSSDVYGLTIVGLITDCASPLQLGFAIQQCLLVSVI
jgi:hypothetical protein